MENQEAFDRLEKIIEELLANLKGLKKDKSSLENIILEKNEENKRLQEVIAGLTDERTSIYKRVNSLLSSVDQWEKSQSEKN